MFNLATHRRILVLGGAASGKSVFAEKLILDHCREFGVTADYLATLPRELADGDLELAKKIAAHRCRRDQRWSLTEQAIKIAPLIREETERPLLVDCLTLWLNNLIYQGLDCQNYFTELGNGVKDSTRPLVLVSNELGLGLVPAEAESRRFRQLQGELNQIAAAACDRVILVIAGQPLVVK
ncbi:MAG: bifunctional adenosylcobinamide kinase/adenosylcobinamide-phosphate guanylyltransferase [Candidatus Pacebacteria bacterium]|nr:bifunctional adenosylcobinamide kinase/adenosylcobinamide-phosphate guanylyltransferase [Candidatus Paceibacterota bacterium]